MTSSKRASLAVLAGLALAGCQTISEEMPASTAAPSNIPTAPVIVVPVPVPVPVPTAGPGPAPTTPVPGPATPTVPTTPNPAPTPRNPSPPTNPGNTGTTVRIGAKVYFVERNGQIIPGTDGATEAAVGDRVHLDATAKDANNLPTTTRTPPNWSYSDPGLVSISGSQGDWTPVLLVRRAGTFSFSVEADGIRSNTVTIHFR